MSAPAEAPDDTSRDDDVDLVKREWAEAALGKRPPERGPSPPPARLVSPPPCSSSPPQRGWEWRSAPQVVSAFMDAQTLLVRQTSERQGLAQPKDQCATSAVQFCASKWRPKRKANRLAFVTLYALIACILWVNTVGLFIPGFNLLMFGYWVYILGFDSKASYTSGRPWKWVKDWKLWQQMGDYFPMSLHPTQELDPSKTYIFGYHPHGIISLGALVCFATNGVGFDRKFPGIDLRLLTLRVNFLVPALRELLLWLGICDVSKRSITHHLSRGSGAAVMIVVGGAAESLASEYNLTLRHRKGFVKIALTTGSSLVPVFSFGETDLFEMQESSGIVSKLQQALKKTLGFTIPLFHGRGIFIDWGMLPYHKPVTVVVGRPIDCPKIANPTQEDIDKYHADYVNGLVNLFNDNKKHVAFNRTQELRIH